MTPEIYPILFVIVSAFTTVTIDGLINNLPLTLVLWLVTSIAIVYFHGVNYRNLRPVYHAFQEAPWLVLAVNISIAITWAATYFGIAYLGASVYNIFYFSITAILATFLGQKRVRPIQAILLIIVLAAGTFILKLSLVGALISLLAGIAGFTQV